MKSDYTEWEENRNLPSLRVIYETHQSGVCEICHKTGSNLFLIDNIRGHEYCLINLKKIRFNLRYSCRHYVGCKIVYAYTLAQAEKIATDRMQHDRSEYEQHECVEVCGLRFENEQQSLTVVAAGEN